MQKITFTDEETKREIEFVVLSTAVVDDQRYMLVVEDENGDDELDDMMSAYVIKEVRAEEDDVIYEIVSDENELELVTEELMDQIEDEFDIE